MCGGPEGTAFYAVAAAIHREYFTTHRSQKDIASILGVTPQYLSRIANGRQRLTTRMAALMHSRLGWPAFDFLTAQIYADFDRAVEADFDAQREAARRNRPEPKATTP